MWNNLKDKSIIFPSSSTIILLMDIDENEHFPFKYTIMPVVKVLEICDKPYCHWTHWMRIPPIETDYIDEEELDKIANSEELIKNVPIGQGLIRKYGRDCYKAGYRKAKEE